MERIQALAEVKDDPYAWRDLLCGYRNKRIRRPLQKAYKDIGEAFLFAFARRIGGDWGADVMTYLERKAAEKRRKPLPPQPPQWHWTDRPYWDD